MAGYGLTNLSGDSIAAALSRPRLPGAMLALLHPTYDLDVRAAAAGRCGSALGPAPAAEGRKAAGSTSAGRRGAGATLCQDCWPGHRAGLEARTARRLLQSTTPALRSCHDLSTDPHISPHYQSRLLLQQGCRCLLRHIGWIQHQLHLRAGNHLEPSPI